MKTKIPELIGLETNTAFKRHLFIILNKKSCS